MVSLIKEDFPFEINSWLGGVKANEAKKPKYPLEECLDGPTFPPAGSQPTIAPSGDGGGSTMDVEDCLDGPRGSQPTHAPSGGDGGGGSTMDVESLLRLATDAFEERAVSMFAGYTLSVKDHFDQVTSSLKELVGAELAELKRMLRHDNADGAITTSTAPSAAKPNDGRISEGGPTNGTRHTEETQDGSPNGDSARQELCVPPTASGERSPEKPVNNVLSLDARPEAPIIHSSDPCSPDVQQIIASSHFLNDDVLRDIEDSTSFSLNEVSTELPMFKDPGRFVLTSVEKALTGASERGELSLAEPIVKTLVPLLEELARVAPSTDPGLQHDATRVALQWARMMGSSVEKSQLEAWAFLQFIVAFGLVKLTTPDQNLQLASRVAHFKHAPKLFESLGLTHAIPNFVTELLNKAMHIPAIRFMLYFKVENNFSPLELLKEQIINLRLSAKENRRYESQADAATMRDIMELIEDFKLEIDIPVDLIFKFMVPREIQNLPVQSPSDTVFQSSCIATDGSNPSQAGGSTEFQGQSSHQAGSKRPRVVEDPEGSRPVIRPCFNRPPGFGRF
ncbi:hypothetical protein DY000_02011215 [Brassica cretica]|uniref:FRIGIDA-like protein n=1 Tax=Brassica cretica TaxID=69181 RepID=A0ABQ7D6I6_BRACR|nr:hypothetical protein DY000_02011215 [Brassica cretica]